jgi:hypothetical protein
VEAVPGSASASASASASEEAAVVAGFNNLLLS